MVTNWPRTGGKAMHVSSIIFMIIFFAIILAVMIYSIPKVVFEKKNTDADPQKSEQSSSKTKER